jgi:hypothetical protein
MMNIELIIERIFSRFQSNKFEIVEKNTSKPNGKRIIIKTPTGPQHKIITRFLNLDEAEYIKITKSDFYYELRENLFVLQVVYMKVIELFSHLIPNKVFETPSHIFIDNEQPSKFRHLSSWEIKVFRKAIEELSKYSFN